jgi:hypothetical protein
MISELAILKVDITANDWQDSQAPLGFSMVAEKGAHRLPDMIR